MSSPERRLKEDRATRNAARGVFGANISQIKADLEARGIRRRIADKADHEVRQAVTTGLDIASESKGIIAGVIGALGLWFFRKPIIAKFKGLLSPADPAQVHDRADSAPGEEG